MKIFTCYIIFIFIIFTPIYGNDYENNIFYFFYSYDCPHCRQARVFVKNLSQKYHQIKFKEFEICKNKKNRELFKEMSKELNIPVPGVPAFIYGDRYVIGYESGYKYYEYKIYEMIENQLIDKNIQRRKDINFKKTIRSIITKKESEVYIHRDEREISIPIIGKIKPRIVSLPFFTLFLGLTDGINPCAMWVLMFLLTLLVNAGKREKIILVGLVFVFTSGIVYFTFMTAWLNIFMFMGIKNTGTIILGIIVIFMGLINVKELFFFRKSISFMIPERSKPKLYQKMRRIMESPNIYLSILGTILLAFFVNLIELGCTIGLPAIYTRVLYIQQINTITKYFYMALYNLYYIMPLLLIVFIYVFTLGKYRLSEKHAKILKLISGLLMVSLGIILVINPHLLIFR